MSSDGLPQCLCATRLHPVGSIAPDATGVATVMRSSGRMVTAFVIVGPLPDPASLGYAYYVFLVVDPDSGAAVIRQPMVTLPAGEFGDDVWGGTATVGLDDCELPCGPVMVFASDINGSLGPQVAAGVLEGCR